MKIPETEITGKQVTGWLAVAAVILAAGMSVMTWVVVQSMHRTETIERWEEYDTLWEEPIEKRKKKFDEALTIIKEQEAEE